MTMSQTPPTASSYSDFQSIFNAALREYEVKTKINLLAHPLAAQWRTCDSPTAILAVLRDQVQKFDQHRSSDERLTKWLNPTVNVLYALSATLGEGVGLVFSPAKVIFTGVGVLLLAAKDVDTSRGMLADLFERLEAFFRRLESPPELPLTRASPNIIAKFMTEVLSILATATNEIKQPQTTPYVKTLMGNNDVADALKRLDKLIWEEARTATTEILEVAHSVGDKVDEVIADCNEVKGIVQRMERETKVVMHANNVDDGMRSTPAVLSTSPGYSKPLTREQLRNAAKKWLSPPDPSMNHDLASNVHHEGTATWFFQDSIFKEWRSTPSLLWIHGKPGSGKSILCSAMIQHVMALRNDGLSSLAYFYFDFRDENKQSLDNLLRSLLFQLSAQSDLYRDILSHLYREHDHGQIKPSDRILTKCLKEMLSHPTQGPVYLILDALDECPNNHAMSSAREQVTRLITDLLDLRSPNLHITVTSRPEVDIRTALEPRTSLRISLQDQSGQRKDIADYINSVVYSDTKMRRWREKDRRLVCQVLSEEGDGMFRWVRCQLQMLRDCFPSSVRLVLGELPKTLDDTYERILMDINEANREHAYRLLQCLTVAIRPLRVEELAEVLAVNFDAVNQEGIAKLNPDWRWEDHHEAVLSTCSSLITIVNDRGSQVVQFSHFSVKEFLTSERIAQSNSDVSHYHILLEPAHTILAQACLGVLLYSGLDRATLWNLPLREYALSHWVDHARFENVSLRILHVLEYFFDADNPHRAAWLQMDKPWVNFIYEVQDHAVPLYYAAACGLYYLVERLISKHPQHVNAKGGRRGTPLVAALHEQHIEVAQLLYQRGADVHIRGNRKRTLLHAAAVDNLVDTVQWLLDHGGNVNANCANRQTPLHLAVRNRPVNVVRMLLEHKADVNAQNVYGRTPLHLAVYNGHIDVVRVLLEHNANVNAQNVYLRTPLHVAVDHGHLNLARMLIEHKANINAEDYSGRVALHIASDPVEPCDQLDIMRLLLELGDANASDNEGSTLLYKPLIRQGRRYIQSLKSSVERRVNINAKDHKGNTALQVASVKGYFEVVKLLREYGASFRRGCFYGSEC